MGATLRVLGWVVLSLPLIAVIAFLSTRLLGVRRSVLDVAASAVLGWVVGFGVALAVAGGDINDADILRDTIVVAFIATMAVSVTFELLARPGAPRPGLLSIPRPDKWARERIDILHRSREIVGIAYDNGFGPVLGRRRRRRKAELDRAPEEVRVRRTLEQCGGMFVKLGQIASTRSDLLPPEVIEQLKLLQNEVAPEDPGAMRELIESELGAPVEEVFADFDWEPVGRASIAQVYRATLVSGEPVVVKAQRPGVGEIVRRDSVVLLRLTQTLQDESMWGRQYQVYDLATEFVDNVRQELDFNIEAQNAKTVGENMTDLPGVRVPTVYEAFSTPRLLVMERFDGPTAGESSRIDELGVDRPAMADAMLRAMLKQMMTDGYFHADPHPGNLIVLENGDVGFIDFGACGRLDPLEEASLQQMLMATAMRDASMLRQAVAEVMDIGPEVDDDALERALARFLADHIKPGQGVSGSAMNDLMDMLQEFGIRIPGSLTMFGRAIVTLEGTLRALSPGYEMADEAQRVGVEWVQAKKAEVTGDLDTMVKAELLNQAPILRALPRHVDRLARQAEKGELSAHVSLFSGESDTRFVAKMVNRVLLGFLGAVLGVVAAMLLTTDKGPEFAGSVTLLNFFGYVGLFGSAVLTMRVIAAILREGLN